MAKVPLAEEMKERPAQPDGESVRPGPFIAISRQYGCWGFSLGLLLMEILNEDLEAEHTWHIYQKEILERLASETQMTPDVLQQQRRTKPTLITSLFRSLSKDRMPSGLEIRNRTTAIIRQLATDGYAILVGQGSAGATQDFDGGLSVRLEAPEDWRVKQVAFREGISETQAKIQVQEMQQQSEYLRKVYATRYPRQPAFHITCDCSVFTLAQVAKLIVQALRMRGLA